MHEDGKATLAEPATESVPGRWDVLAAWLDRALWWIAPVALFLLLYEWRAQSFATSVVLIVIDLAVALLFVTHVVVHALRSGAPGWYLLTHPLDLVVLVPVSLSIYEPTAASAAVLLRQATFLVKVFSRGRKLRLLFERVQLRPKQWLAASFLLTILAGTFLLSLPIASAASEPISWIDAAFTSTSAVCVTGLIVKDTPVDFSLFGQVVILGLIQVGGLGIMTLSTSIILLAGKKMGLKKRLEMQDLMDEDSTDRLVRLFGSIVEYTFLLEFLGAMILGIRWAGEMGSFTTALWYGIFHSVSAFCNAGFALFSDSLCRYVGDPVVNGVICVLIMAGGLGFAAIENVKSHWQSRKAPRPVPLTVHTRLALTVTAWLVVIGAAFFFFAEYGESLAGASPGERLLASFFQSVTTRTAGFNTVDLGKASAATLLLMMALMFIGASPGSTAGGVKTTTFSVLLLTLRSVLLGEEDVRVHSRSISASNVARAFSIIGIAAGVVFFFALALLMTEDGGFMEILFEVFSAFGTVGLSIGMTAKLSAVGKVLIIVLMYIGRIGPLTLVLALGERSERELVGYPEAKILLG